MITDRAAAGTPIHLAPASPRGAGLSRLGLVLLVVLLIGAPSLIYPFGRDQGEYATIAELAMGGRVIYRDVFNVKPPATHLLHALALTLFSRSMQAIRWLDLLWQAATALVLLRIAARIGLNRRAALLAPVVYAIAHYAHDFWNTAQTDGFLNLPAALAVLAFLRAHQRGERWAYAASGAAIGVAVLFKYPIGILLPLLWLCAALARRRPWRALVWMSLGCSLPLIGCAGWLYAEGALLPFIDSQFHYLTRYVGRNPTPFGRLRLLALILRFQLRVTIPLGLACLCGAFLLASAPRHRRGSGTMILVSWLLAACIDYLAQGKGYLYHGLPILAPAALLAAQVTSRASARDAQTRWLHLLFVALATTSLAWPVTLYARQLHESRSVGAVVDVLAGDISPQHICRSEHPLCYSGDPGFALPDQLAAAEFIAAHSEPSDPLFVWGFEPTIYFAAERKPASRFIFNLVFVGDWRWPELREQLLADLAHRPPRYVVVARDDARPLNTGVLDDSATALQGFAELRHLIETDYRLDAIFGNLTLYRAVP